MEEGTLKSRDETTANRNAAFVRLAEREYTRLRRLAYRFGVPANELDDAAQEILARAWAGWSRFRGDSAPETWLTKIAVNWLTSWRRTLQRRLREIRISRLPDPATVPNPEGAEAQARAAECVRRLPPKLRSAFVLRYLEGLRAAEVGRMLGISEEAVRARAFDARRKLRAMLEEDER